VAEAAAPTRAVLRTLRDDGVCSRALGRLAAGALPPLLATTAGVLVTVILVMVGIAGHGGVILFAPVAALLLAGVGAEHGHDGRRDHWVPPMLRGTEFLYASALGFGLGVPGPLVLLLVTGVIVHHGVVVERIHHGRPVGWIPAASLGWDGRMLLLAVGGMLDAAPLVWGMLAGYLWVLAVRSVVVPRP
jgi:hypothetical protein